MPRWSNYGHLVAKKWLEMVVSNHYLENWSLNPLHLSLDGQVLSIDLLLGYVGPNLGFFLGKILTENCVIFYNYLEYW